jgi:hypothetical protein
MSLFHRIKDPVEGSMHVEAFSGEAGFEIWSKQWPQPGAEFVGAAPRRRTRRPAAGRIGSRRARSVKPGAVG